MRKLSIAGLIVALIAPCCLDLERPGCCVFAVIFLALAVLAARKYSPDMFC